MSQVTCPKCQTLTEKGQFHPWQLIVAICFFPIGLLALLADRKPTQCSNCGNSWQS